MILNSERHGILGKKIVLFPGILLLSGIFLLFYYGYVEGANDSIDNTTINNQITAIDNYVIKYSVTGGVHFQI